MKRVSHTIVSNLGLAVCVIMPSMRRSLYPLLGIGIAIIMSPFFVFAQNVEERRILLEQELAKVEAQIAEQQDILNARSRESVSLERDIAILNATDRKSTRLNSSHMSISY